MQLHDKSVTVNRAVWTRVNVPAVVGNELFFKGILRFYKRVCCYMFLFVKVVRANGEKIDRNIDLSQCLHLCQQNSYAVTIIKVHCCRIRPSIVTVLALRFAISCCLNKKTVYDQVYVTQQVLSIAFQARASAYVSSCIRRFLYNRYVCEFYWQMISHLTKWLKLKCQTVASIGC